MNTFLFRNGSDLVRISLSPYKYVQIHKFLFCIRISYVSVEMHNN